MMKNPIIAFLLAFFPGGGLLYLGKIRGLFYTFAVFGLFFFVVFLEIVLGFADFFFIIIFALGGFLMYVVNFIDTGVTASKFVKGNGSGSSLNSTEGNHSANLESERFFTIILSVIPGLGHFQLGLMNRGLTLLAAFFGLGAMVVFVTALSHRGEFLVFLALLPVLWVYSFFDAMQLLNKKQTGEEIVDRSLLEEFESRREDGKKSKSMATLLSIFPGAGHLYLGLQRRGIQLMAAFLFSIYILDVLRLGIFLFFVPLIWFYSFFDGLQKASKFDEEPLEDTPVISYLVNNQKWVGIGLVVLGVYYLLTNIAMPILSPLVYQYIHIDLDLGIMFERYFQTAVVCILLIGGGIKLLSGSKRKSSDKKEVSE